MEHYWLKTANLLPKFVRTFTDILGFEKTTNIKVNDQFFQPPQHTYLSEANQARQLSMAQW